MINIEFKSLFELQEAFPTEQICIDQLEAIRWNGDVISPFDPSSKVYKCKDNKYRCKNTRKYFNIRTNTLFDNTKIELRKWFFAIWLVTSHKKGISSYQLAKDIDVTQKTGWFMLQRIRKCFGISENEPPLDGEVEMDETFVGGKNKNRHKDKKVPKSTGRAHIDKTPVLGMVERGGRLVAQVIPDTSQKSITPIVLQWVCRSATVYTDEWQGYDKVDKLYHREFVDHGRKQYKNGNATTNTIEGFWSIFKRGIIGIYQMASRKHLQEYVDDSADVCRLLDLSKRTLQGWRATGKIPFSMLGGKIFFKSRILPSCSKTAQNQSSDGRISHTRVRRVQGTDRTDRQGSQRRERRALEAPPHACRRAVPEAARRLWSTCISRNERCKPYGTTE